MARKIVVEKDKLFECPACGYRWTKSYDLSFDEEERCPCCPDCGELIEDGDDDNYDSKYMKYFDIHVNYDGTEDSAGYSIFVEANVANEHEALQYAINNHLFTEDGDEQCVDYINEIDEADFHNATGK